MAVGIGFVGFVVGELIFPNLVKISSDLVEPVKISSYLARSVEI